MKFLKVLKFLAGLYLLAVLYYALRDGRVDVAIFLLVILAILYLAFRFGKRYAKNKKYSKTRNSHSSSHNFSYDSLIGDSLDYEDDLDDDLDYYDPELERSQFKEIKLAGVTFKNDDGSSRQANLQNLKAKAEPFDNNVNLEFERYDFQGEPAVLVTANGFGLGNIPKSEVDFILYTSFTLLEYKVIGGGQSKSGQSQSYGCILKIRYE